MDGYTLTEKMRQARRRSRLSATEQALYYELVAICNCEGWEDVFKCSNMELCLALGGIDVKTLGRARNNLINAKLIYYKSAKSKKEVGSYSFKNDLISGNIPLKTTPKVTTQTTTQAPNPYKTKTKLNILILDGEEKVLSESLFNLLEEILSNENYLHMMYKNSPIRDLDKIKTYLKRFFVELEMRGDTYKTTEDAIQHFSSWLKIELEKNVKQKGGGNGNRQNPKSASAVSQEDFARNIAEGIARANFEKQ